MRKPRVTAGLKCPPEMCPRAVTMIARMRPCAIATPSRSPPPVITEPAPTNTRANAPTNSATDRRRFSPSTRSEARSQAGQQVSPRVLRCRDRRYGTGWALGSWFVPILNAWRPKQIINDIWHQSGLSCGGSHGSSGHALLDRGSRGWLVGVELFVYSEKGGTDVRFDNVFVCRLLSKKPTRARPRCPRRRRSG